MFITSTHYSCHILRKLESTRKILEKYSNIKFNKHPSCGSQVVPHGRTDMTNRIVAFRNFANAPKMDSSIILRCVIPVVLSNNNNKLMVHMYIVKNTTIFLIVRLLLIRYDYMFRPAILAIFRLYMKHLTISYIYT